MFTYQQFMSAIRWGMTAAGTALGTYGVSVNGAVWEAVMGVVLAGAPFIWSMIRHTSLGTILAADSEPDVAGVIMKQTSEGRSIAAPSNSPVTVAVQGTTAAATVAGANDPRSAARAL